MSAASEKRISSSVRPPSPRLAPTACAAVRRSRGREEGEADPREVVHPLEGELLQRERHGAREADGDGEEERHLPGGAPRRRRHGETAPRRRPPIFSRK